MLQPASHPSTNTVPLPVQVGHFVKCLICGDDGIPGKPHPQNALNAAQTLEVSPKEMIMVMLRCAAAQVCVLSGLLNR